MAFGGIRHETGGKANRYSVQQALVEFQSLITLIPDLKASASESPKETAGNVWQTGVRKNGNWRRPAHFSPKPKQLHKDSKALASQGKRYGAPSEPEFGAYAGKSSRSISGESPDFDIGTAGFSQVSS